MVWIVEFDRDAFKELEKLDPVIQRRILSYLRQRIATDDDPHRFGKALQRDLIGLWRYRVGDYRIVCSIEPENLRVLILRIGHRSDVYEQ